MSRNEFKEKKNHPKFEAWFCASGTAEDGVESETFDTYGAAFAWVCLRSGELINYQARIVCDNSVLWEYPKIKGKTYLTFIDSLKDD